MVDEQGAPCAAAPGKVDPGGLGGGAPVSPRAGLGSGLGNPHASMGGEWLTQQSNWIGYVAVCESEREVARMGRRDIAIVLRGTATCLEWVENLCASLVPLDGESSGGSESGAEEPKVARGFLSLYKTAGEKVKSMSAEVMDEVRRLMEKYKGEELSITVVSHSLCAALALLVADEVATSILDGAFVERFNRIKKFNVLRIVNAGDMVTKVPWVAPRLPLKEQYHHMGAELRIDSKNSPCLRLCRHLQHRPVGLKICASEA